MSPSSLVAGSPFVCLSRVGILSLHPAEPILPRAAGKQQTDEWPAALAIDETPRRYVIGRATALNPLHAGKVWILTNQAPNSQSSRNVGRGTDARRRGGSLQKLQIRKKLPTTKILSHSSRYGSPRLKDHRRPRVGGNVRGFWHESPEIHSHGHHRGPRSKTCPKNGFPTADRQ
jgi:hypothetical protein